MSFLIAVAGKINSGKTTFAKFIVNEYGFNYVSFGDYIRTQANINGLTNDRKTLQDLGQSFINSDIKKFCEQVLYSNNWDGKSNIVIDGVRHLDVYNTINEVVGNLLIKLVYIKTNESERENRTVNGDLTEFDKHPVEQDSSNKLLDVADLVINGNLNLDENRKLFDNWIISLNRLPVRNSLLK